ncbi:MAG TPA: hypothetical protein DEO70_07715 [Bacteroidales bacterium]|nr:MAG: hypothetical protein A2X09_06245 [Bacteroidetes bacterium GWF2_43_11]HBZ66709.1 hypothetical protein [Bacteroidales bacterium]
MSGNNFRLVFFIVMLVAFTGGSVVAQHDPPVVVNDTVFMSFGEKRWVNLLKNDYDPDGLPLKLFNSPFSIKTDSSVLVDMSAFRYMSFSGLVRFRYIVRQYPSNGGTGRIGTGYLIVQMANVGVDSLQNKQIKACLSVTNGQFSMFNNQHVMPGEEIAPGDVCSYNYPALGKLATLYTMSLWAGGLDLSGVLHFSGERYRRNGSDFWAGPLSVESDSVTIDTSTVMAYHRIWHISVADIVRHRQQYSVAGYVLPEPIASWPAHGDTAIGQSRYLAPFVDVDGNGCYEPLQGDYPLIRGDEAVWFMLNDHRLKERESSPGNPLGIELHCMAYVFHHPEDSALSNAIFFNYRIFNRSNIDYHKFYLGIFADFDIGYPDDDYVRCDVTRGSMIGYNGNPIDGNDDDPGYGDNPPAQSVTILSGPLLPADGIDNKPDPDSCENSFNGSGFDDGKPDNERIGMSRFIYFNNGNSGAMSDPDSAAEYFNYMQGIWLDGSMVEYGGHGHYGTGAYGPACRYMYPDDSDTAFFGTFCAPPFGPVNWTEEIAGNNPGDRRGLASMGPVDFRAGSVQLLDIVLVTGRGSSGQSSLGVLQSRIDTIRKQFLLNPDFFGSNITLQVNEQMRSNEIKVWPNPASSYIRIGLPQEYFKYTIRNQVGQVCKTGLIPDGGVIYIEELYSGFYVIAFEGTSQCRISRFIKL